MTAWVKSFRGVEHIAKPAANFRIACDFAVVKDVGAVLCIDEIGMDFPVVNIGYDQKRRVAEGVFVFCQLLESSLKIFVLVGRFVFNGEVILIKDISETVPALRCFYRLLENEFFARFGFAVAARHLDADQAADIKKMRLRDLFLAQRGPCPSVDEYLRRHSV